MKRQDRYERTTMYAPIWIANQIGEKGKENNFSFKEKKNFSFIPYCNVRHDVLWRKQSCAPIFYLGG